VLIAVMLGRFLVRNSERVFNLKILGSPNTTTQRVPSRRGLQAAESVKCDLRSNYFCQVISAICSSKDDSGEDSTAATKSSQSESPLRKTFC